MTTLSCSPITPLPLPRAHAIKAQVALDLSQNAEDQLEPGDDEIEFAQYCLDAIYGDAVYLLPDEPDYGMWRISPSVK